MVSFNGDPIFNEQNLDQFLLALVSLKFKLDFSLPDLLTSLERISINMVIVSNGIFFC